MENIDAMDACKKEDGRGQAKHGCREYKALFLISPQIKMIVSILNLKA